MKVNYPEMVLNKSEGVSDSERYLIDKCRKTFLSLWSYPNPYTCDKNGKELCDVITVFGNHVFLFSDKFCKFGSEAKVEVAWNRWYKHAIKAGAKQILGAERYLRSGGSVYLDAKRTQPFPFMIPKSEDLIIHRIIVARGAREACIRYFGGGTGSLAINTTIIGDRHICNMDLENNHTVLDSGNLFTVGIIVDREHYIHIFDDYTLDCIMNELDTASDLIDYIEQKEDLIFKGKDMIAMGEEDVLGRYLSIVENDKHCILLDDELKNHQAYSFSGFWNSYMCNPDRNIKIKANEKSYFWDELLEKTFISLMNGTLRDMSHPDYPTQLHLFYYFVIPNRVERRVLADAFIESFYIANKTIDINSNITETMVRRVHLSSKRDILFTFLWLHCPLNQSLDVCLKMRKRCLEAKMLSSLPKTREFIHHIGIAKMLDLEMDDSEDFLYINASDFPDNCAEIKSALSFVNNLSTLRERSAYNNY